MRWPRQVASLLFLALLLCGPPVVMVEIVGWPLHGWPTLRQAQLWVAKPLTEQTLTAALTVLAWLVWLLLAATVTVRALTRMRAGARWLRRMPLPTPLQTTATGMAGAAAFGVGAHATTTAPPDHPLAVAAGTLDDHGDADAADSSHLIDTRGSDGIVVSGGWLPRDVAEQVGAAAALVWLRRRRAYRPRPPGSEGRDEPDLTPLPATVAAVQAALATGNTHPSSTEPTPAVTGDACGVLPAPPAGLRPAGVGLTGPGALAAARGVLVTVLLAGLRQPPGAVPIVITHTALTALLGSAAETVRHRLPGIRVATTIEDAVAFLESTASPTCPATPPLQRQEDAPPVGVHTPPVLIIEALPTPATTDRLAAAVTVGAGVPVVLGDWSAGVTWQVDAAGHTHDLRQSTQAEPRLCILDQVATTDLLTVIGHAHPPPHARPHHPPEPLRPRVPRQATSGETPSRPRATTRVVSRRLDLRVLGEPTLLVDGEPLIIRRSAALQVLVFLTVHRSGASSRQLVEAIWPGLPAHSLTGRLYTTLSELRGTVRAACGLSVIDHTDDRYRINPAHLDADLWRLQAAVQHAATAVADHGTAWQAVVDAYPGDLAAGYVWPWLEPPREATRRHVVDAYVALASTQSDPRRALALLQGGVRVDPYNENLHLRAMKALAALGDHTAITDLCDSYTRRLAAAGLEPSDGLRDAAAHLSNAHPVPGR
ncbi:BTAD domain-containing putative transcriptional regulator [Micromonospora sp. 4G57]|uniref:BTAD domain-containing putative transcriptional regulator n=1 Tax=Micromonospora sicca TaxID=2202420 RepID=A0ABU5JQ24_9ACTN|nr:MULTISPECIES: BTAD domain-containing putative transcriptional regulator [unclassified Micromonospora]MDZ5447734.1 BTAD domain-containing putative transcriptional regulator [Micromonospora sp. 4G57]MDZ5494419.1 BTAD domain-containing putative transcriptional regulator [Micromonospora sp. 4G53]